MSMAAEVFGVISVIAAVFLGGAGPTFVWRGASYLALIAATGFIIFVASLPPIHAPASVAVPILARIALRGFAGLVVWYGVGMVAAWFIKKVRSRSNPAPVAVP